MDGLFEPDVRYEDADGSRLAGSDAVVEMFQGWKKAFPDARAEQVRTVIADEDHVVVELDWTATLTGVFDVQHVLGAGTSPLGPTGRRVFSPAVIVARLRDRRIAEMRHYYDMTAFLKGIVAPLELAAWLQANYLPAAAPDGSIERSGAHARGDR
jgi:predicted ester cyclase